MSEAQVDASSIPASALPPGADPATYVAEKTGAALGQSVPQTPADVAAEERPAHVPEKFWDAANKRVNTDALLKSYTELEKMKSKAPEAPAAEKPADAPAQDPNKATIAAPDAKPEGEQKPGETPAASPLTEVITTLTTAFEAGKLGEDQFKAAEAAGLPREVVETYFAGLKALQSSQQLALETAVGGKDTLEAARTWGATGLTPAELEFYNSNVLNPATAEMAVKWLAEKYTAANPSEGKLLTDGGPSAPAGDVFRSAAEVTKAMSDPQYRTDPAYRQAVAEKMQRSKAAGTYDSGAQFFKGSR